MLQGLLEIDNQNIRPGVGPNSGKDFGSDGSPLIWPLSDNAASAVVLANESGARNVAASLVIDGSAGNTSVLASTLNNKPAFLTDANRDTYVQATLLPMMRPGEIKSLWTKDADNPLEFAKAAGGNWTTVRYGQIVPNPAGGYYFYGTVDQAAGVHRWESTDLKAWTNDVTCVAATGVASYTTGTVTVTNGSAAVTGSGTTFSEAMIGRLFQTTVDQPGTDYIVSAVADTTHLTLATNYSGTGGADKTYSIADFDKQIYVATVIDTGVVGASRWVMFYRGDNTVAPTYRLGRAISADGETWTKYGTGGAASGRFTGCDSGTSTAFDPCGLMYDDVTELYYLWCARVTTGHGQQLVFTTTDIAAETPTMTEVTPSPRFGYSFTPRRDHFCGSPFFHKGYYYFIATNDFAVAGGTTLYDRAISLYRATEPTFASPDFLGYVIVNDQAYDNQYLDTPTVAVVDNKRTLATSENDPALAADTLYCLYDGRGTNDVQSLATCRLTDLLSRPVVTDRLQTANSATVSAGANLKNISYSRWFQTHTLAEGMSLFSLGSTSLDGTPAYLCNLKATTGTYYVNLFLNAGYKRTTTAISIDTLYHIVVTDDGTTTIVYVNGVLSSFATDSDKLLRCSITGETTIFIGSGFGNPVGSPAQYIQDFRIYPKALSATEVANLYRLGHI